MELSSLVVLAAYALLVVELTLFPIPSEASTYQLFAREAPTDAGSEDALANARTRRPLSKFVHYLLPTAFGVSLFLIPLALIPWPQLRASLFPVQFLEARPFPAIGLGLIIIGRIVTFSSVLQLRRERARERVAEHGWFRRSRNPGLVGMYLFYLGCAVVFPCLVLLLGVFPYVGNMHRRVLMEESHLRQVLGDEYRAYLERIPRYLPLPLLR